MGCWKDGRNGCPASQREGGGDSFASGVDKGPTPELRGEREFVSKCEEEGEIASLPCRIFALEFRIVGSGGEVGHPVEAAFDMADVLGAPTGEALEEGLGSEQRRGDAGF